VDFRDLCGRPDFLPYSLFLFDKARRKTRCERFFFEGGWK
jgi:hypothetical protein